MNPTLIAHALGLLLLLPLASCRPPEPGQDPAAAAAQAMLPGDVDLGHGYVRRDGAIHFIGGGLTGIGANATRIDTPSAELLAKVRQSKFGPFTTCEGLDVASFKPLSEEYARDKERVYYKVISPGEFLVIVLPDADPASFDVLAFNLARDRSHVWFYERIQPGADPSKVELVDGGLVYKDHDSVHYGHEEIGGADPASFRHLASGYYADRNRIYWGPTPVPDADLATFEVLGDSFVAKDKDTAYRSGERLPGFDVATLELILHDPMGYQILSDRNGIHLNAMTFLRSKPGRVEVIDQAAVQSGNRVFLVDTVWVVPVTVFREQGKVMAETPGYDPANRQVLGIVRAEVTEQGLKGLRTAPLPGKDEEPSIPGYQVEAFKSPHMVRRMIEAGKRIK